MAQDKQLFDKAMAAGAKFNEAGNYEKAMSAFRAAIKEFPKDAEAYAGLGEACIGLKQLDRAMDCFKYAARFSGGDISYLRKVADIQERQGRLSDAGRTYLAIGEILYKSNQTDDAIGNWQRAIRLESNLLGAHKRLATTYQRLDMTKDAVRSYLAIARILQMEGELKKALRMCQAALRLDPENEDVLTAVELIRKGADAFELEEEEEEEEMASEPAISAEEQAEADELTRTVRQMAAAFEAERQKAQPAAPATPNSPIEVAKQMAQEHFAIELFRDEDDDEDAKSSLSKLERDALLGQAMDFDSRGKVDDAIGCFKRAIDGGLNLPAAHFALGLLYLQTNNRADAEAMFEIAKQEPAFQTAVSEALG
ncbi:MAG: tetratricopeptide repeat protein [Chloroflexota bacterium]